MTTFALWKGWCCGATTVSTGQRLRSHTFTTQVNFRTVGLFALDAFDHVFFLDQSNTNTNTNTNTKTTDYMINNITPLQSGQALLRSGPASRESRRGVALDLAAWPLGLSLAPQLARTKARSSR